MASHRPFVHFVPMPAPVRKLLTAALLSLVACGDACETTSESTSQTPEPQTSGTPTPGASGRIKPRINFRDLGQGAAEAGAPAASAVP